MLGLIKRMFRGGTPLTVVAADDDYRRAAEYLDSRNLLVKTTVAPFPVDDLEDPGRPGERITFARLRIAADGTVRVAARCEIGEQRHYYGRASVKTDSRSEKCLRCGHERAGK